MPASAIQPELLEVRRYPNRRLYDVTRSKTVTLDELYRLVREGFQIRVTEKASGVDITTRVLTQMILDWDSGKLEMFPKDLLHAVLQANEKLVGDFFETHLREALEMFTKSREQLEEQWKPLMRPSVETGWVNPWMAAFMPQASGAAPGAGGDGDLREMVEELQVQVAALRKEMSGDSPAPPDTT